jgi:signal transduction histidine kinase
VILIGSEFFFVQVTLNTILVAITLVVSAGLGLAIIRSVKREIAQREELARLNVDLQSLLKQRESLMHLINHKVKGSFTRTKLLFDGMLTGTFGEISPEIRKRAQQGFDFDNGGLDTVDTMLNVASMQNGIIKYEMKPVDFKDLVEKVISEKKIPVENKGLKMESDIKPGNYNVTGDAVWLKEAINNLVENSIRYTKEGNIVVGLENQNNKILFSVKDTGVGITEEDMKNLFTEGGRGKDSIKVNVDSTGYGLYTVKMVIEGHKGRVWGESEGPGKGSQFYIELPVGDK